MTKSGTSVHRSKHSNLTGSKTENDDDCLTMPDDCF